MQQSAVVPSNAIRPGEVPLLVRFLGRIVLEVLPAALASVIGAFLFAHYQFEHPAVSEPSPPATAATPASAEMVHLVRAEHAMIRNFLVAQRAAEQSRAAAADAADARAAASAKLAAAALHRAALGIAAAKADARHGKPTVVAAAAPVSTAAASAALPPIVVAGVAQNTGMAPAEAPAPVAASLVARTLAVKDHVVAETLHAVMAIGGIPSWIGHRFGAHDLDSGLPPSSAAS